MYTLVSNKNLFIIDLSSKEGKKMKNVILETQKVMMNNAQEQLQKIVDRFNDIQQLPEDSQSLELMKLNWDLDYSEGFIQGIESALNA